MAINFMNSLPWMTKAASKGIDYFKQNKKKNTTAASTNYNNPYYNPYKDVYGIYKAGNDWQAAQDEAKRKEIQKNAQNYYNNLISGGYSKLADTLSKSDSQTRLKYANQYGKQGKTAIRPYFKSLAGQYGLSESDIDNNLRYDNDTGEVFFYGQNMGKPSSVVDGTSYWDTDVLDTNFSNAMNRMGKSKSDDVLYNQDMNSSSDIYRKASEFAENTYNQNVKADNENSKYSRKLLDDYMAIMKENPFTSREADALYSIYGEKGDNAAYGAVADSAGSNSGNIDSFAAANARRQQLAFKNAATEAILNNVYNKLNALGVQMDNVRNTDLSYSQNRWNGAPIAAKTMQNSATGLAENANNRFNNNENRKLNAQNIASKQIDDKVKIAGVTGYVPSEWVNTYNEFLNEDGSIKDKYKNADFKAIMEKARENGDNELLKQASVARMKKIWGDYSKYRQYDDGDYTVNGKEMTADMKQFYQNSEDNRYAVDSAERVSMNGNQTNLEGIDKQVQGNIDVAKIEAQNNLDAIKANKDATSELYEKGGGALLKNDGIGGVTAGTSKTLDGSSLSSKIDNIIKNFNAWAEKEYNEDYKISSSGTYRYTVPKALQEKFVLDIAQDSTLSVEQKQYIIELFNIPDEVIDTVNTDRHYR